MPRIRFVAAVVLDCYIFLGWHFDRDVYLAVLAALLIFNRQLQKVL